MANQSAMKHPHLIKVAIQLQDNPDGIERELLWATNLKNGNCRLENQPVCIDNLNYGDIVKVEFVENDFPVVTAFVARILEADTTEGHEHEDF